MYTLSSICKIQGSDKKTNFTYLSQEWKSLQWTDYYAVQGKNVSHKMRVLKSFDQFTFISHNPKGTCLWFVTRTVELSGIIKNKYRK